MILVDKKGDDYAIINDGGTIEGVVRQYNQDGYEHDIINRRGGFIGGHVQQINNPGKEITLSSK